jgi:hypothetical protein
MPSCMPQLQSGTRFCKRLRPEQRALHSILIGGSARSDNHVVESDEDKEEQRRHA